MHEKVVFNNGNDRTNAAIDFAHQAERLGYKLPNSHDPNKVSPKAVVAKFVTNQDPVIETADGHRLPAVPVDEALKLNELRDKVEGRPAGYTSSKQLHVSLEQTHVPDGVSPSHNISENPGAPLRQAVPQSETHPLFPPLPLYGPPSLLRDLQCYLFRISSFFLSLCFLMTIVLGAVFTSIPGLLYRTFRRLRGRQIGVQRPFHDEEKNRSNKRKEAEDLWKHKIRRRRRRMSGPPLHGEDGEGARFEPLEGGPDPLTSDASHYARREGLDMEDFKVQTEDGFIIDLWHLFDPKEQQPTASEQRERLSPNVFEEASEKNEESRSASNTSRHAKRKYPVLLIHGLLQNSGAYCCTDDKSLAFFLAKSGYDVWLGNNRCGMKPQHNLLQYGDPRMWAWNIRQMGVMDLPALVSRVLRETGFEKLGLVCHSQGTTEAFVALAKDQRPDLGNKISVFCALAPAVYAGPLIQKMYFKFMQAISPAMFRTLFGIHAFIPFMMQMHEILPRRLYGMLGYYVFSFLFEWTDTRWERELRDRMFQFAPVYVSAESMRWWLGRECFAKQKCILATRAEGMLEDEEDQEEDDYFNHGKHANASGDMSCHCVGHEHKDHGRYAWYDERAPPMAMWVAGNDHLVDGRRLIRRFERGREPHVDLVHHKVIEGYEHLDVIWAMDSLDQVGKEVREVIWKTAPEEAREGCITPQGCEDVERWQTSRSSTGAIISGRSLGRGFVAKTFRDGK